MAAYERWNCAVRDDIHCIYYYVTYNKDLRLLAEHLNYYAMACSESVHSTQWPIQKGHEQLWS